MAQATDLGNTGRYFSTGTEFALDPISKEHPLKLK
jgi:hypothetical protein